VKKGSPLFAGQHQSPLLCRDQSPISGILRDVVVLPPNQTISRAVKTFFDPNHIAAGEAVFALSVDPKTDQFRRGFHRRHHTIELLQPVGMAMGKHRQIPARKRRLPTGNGVQSNGWVGDDLFAILPSDFAVIVQPLRLQSIPGHPRRGRADLVLGFKVNALIFEGTVIDPGVYSEFPQALIDMGAPGLPPMLQQLIAVPFAHLGAEPVLVHAAHGQHHMGVGFGPTIRTDVPMHIEVSDHAAGDKLIPDKVPRELYSIGLIKLARNGELDLTGKLGITALLADFDRIPDLLAIMELVGHILRRQHLGMNDAALGRKIVMAVQALVIEPIRRTIGSRGQRARSVGATDDFGREVVDRHSQSDTLSSARRHDV
jgi:hypothetical protein